jgi:XTP/dITP diphosphohydrolase
MNIDRVKLATSNAGKLREYQRLAPNCPFAIEVMPRFADLAAFDEAAPTFAENAAGKALHYSRFAHDVVLAEDSGLVVPALDGAPGVRSARYAGENASDADRIEKLLVELRRKPRGGRDARFVCVIALARHGRALAVVSDFVQGEIVQEPRGANGFGYDPIFFVPELGRTFAEATPDEKDRLSHRGKAFRKLIALIGGDSRKASAPSQ